MTPVAAQRGEIWITDFGATRGREQSGRRPALVISADDYNRSPSGLVVVMPITSRPPKVPWHVEVSAGEGGLKTSGSILCDHLRSVSVDRLVTSLGTVRYPTLEEVERLIRFLLEV
jgi:mRNA interferase MazF